MPSCGLSLGASAPPLDADQSPIPERREHAHSTRALESLGSLSRKSVARQEVEFSIAYETRSTVQGTGE